MTDPHDNRMRAIDHIIRDSVIDCSWKSDVENPGGTMIIHCEDYETALRLYNLLQNLPPTNHIEEIDSHG
jgi:hypothetical protein